VISTREIKPHRLRPEARVVANGIVYDRCAQGEIDY